MQSVGVNSPPPKDIYYRDRQARALRQKHGTSMVSQLFSWHSTSVSTNVPIRVNSNVLIWRQMYVYFFAHIPGSFPLVLFNKCSKCKILILTYQVRQEKCCLLKHLMLAPLWPCLALVLRQTSITAAIFFYGRERSYSTARYLRGICIVFEECYSCILCMLPPTCLSSVPSWLFLARAGSSRLGGT
jgi:hypothetical protein